MNYQQTLRWLLSQLPVYQLQGATAYKEDLTNSLLLAEHLNTVITLQKVALAQGYGWKRFIDLVDQILPKKAHALSLET